MIVVITVVVSLVFVYVFYRYNAKQSIVPQGLKLLPLEKGVPILGILPQIKPTFPIYLAKLSEKHGPLYRIRMGMRDIVVINDFDTMKKSLKEKGEAFSGRFKIELFSTIIRDSGIILIDGEKWVKQKAFIMTVLRDFGVGKSKSQEIVQSECLHFLEELKKMDGDSINICDLINVYTANIISKFIMNRRFSREDPKLQLIEKIMDDSKSTDLVALLSVMFPMLGNSKLFCKFIVTVASRYKAFDKVHSYFREEIEEHRKRLDLTSEGEDLIDRFLIKQNEMREKTGNVDTFIDFQLIRNSLELFIGGYETTSLTLGWSFLFLAKFQDVQEKVYLEIVDKLGNEKMPTINDKRSLNYCQAVMDEISRLASVAPLSINHRTLKDTVVNGYFIPKDSLIFPNLFASHIDPNVWKNPFKFKPERFLTVDNDGALKYSPREELIPFSMGKRQCLGESLARMEFFIFFISIFQNFKIRLTEELSETKYEEVLLGDDGFFRFPKIKNFILSCRDPKIQVTSSDYSSD